MAAYVNAIERVKEKYGLNVTLKPQQTDIISYLLDGCDVFGLLPTGFGKSMTYIFVPLILDELKGERDVWHTSLVISHLKALMADQVEYLKSHNIPAASLSDETEIKDIRGGRVSVLFASPEAATLAKWMKIIKEDLKSRICVLVFDEAHCISTWGLDFRPAYREVSVVQSIIDKPNLVLTATATKSIQRDIYEHLGFKVEETKVVAALPDRPNIFLDMRASTDKYENELAWVLNHLISDVKQKKIIIYVRSINICYNLYLWIVSEMKHHFFVNDSPSLQNRRVEMFHANTDKDSKDRIMEQFIKEDGNIQVLISTVAFGMGINIPDVSIVVHWGLPATSLSYWQEVGRCARDGRKGYAVCYGFKRSISKCEEEEMKECIKLENCLRFAVLAQFQLDGMPEQFLQALKITTDCINGCQHCSCSKCQCCTVCCSLCTCEGKIDDPLNAFLIS